MEHSVMKCMQLHETTDKQDMYDTSIPLMASLSLLVVSMSVWAIFMYPSCPMARRATHAAAMLPPGLVPSQIEH